jgi:hypothetical protein
VPVLLELMPEVPLTRAGVTVLPPSGWLTEKVTWMLYSLTSGGDSCDAIKEQARASAHWTSGWPAPTRPCAAMRCDAMRCDAMRCDAMRCRRQKAW